VVGWKKGLVTKLGFLVTGILDFGRGTSLAKFLRNPTKRAVGRVPQGNLRIKGFLKGGSQLGQKGLAF